MKIRRILNYYLYRFIKMSFNKENEMYNNIIHEESNISSVVSLKKNSRKNSLNNFSDNVLNDKEAIEQNGALQFDYLRANSKINFSNVKNTSSLNYKENHYDKQLFENNFFVCLKYILFKNEFKKNFKMGIPEKNV